MPVEVKQRVGSNLLPVPLGDGIAALEELTAKVEANTAAVAQAASAASAAQTAANSAASAASSVQAKVDNAATGLAATKAIADAALPKTTAASTYATKTECNAAKTQADQGVSDAAAAKAVADAALPKAGGEVSGFIKLLSSGIIGDLPLQPITSNRLRFVDANKMPIGDIFHTYDSDGISKTTLAVFNKKTDNTETNASMSLCLAQDGTTYATCPPPRNLHNNDIATFGSVMDYAPQKATSVINIFIKSDGSDTADLNNGRGLSPEKPFKSIWAAWIWATDHYSSNQGIVFNLMDDDIEVPSNMYVRCISNAYVKLMGYNGVKTLKSGGAIIVRHGALLVENVNFTATKTIANFLKCEGGYGECYTLLQGGVSFNGTVNNATLSTVNGGQIMVTENLSGNVTGVRYKSLTGSKFITNGKGPNAIPGTEDGVCDASSVYA